MTVAMGLFMHAVYQDGTLAAQQSPEELLETLNRHEKRVEGSNAFLVTACDELNELAPVEVLAGRYFKAREESPGHTVWVDGQAKQEPYTEVDIAAQRRILEASVEVRAAKVIAAAKLWGVYE